MYCIKCGKQLEDGTKFCIFCGSKQEDPAPVYAPAAAPEENVPSAPVYEAPAESAPSAPVYEAPKESEPFSPVYEAPKAPVFENVPPKFDSAPPVSEPPAKKKGKGSLVLCIVLGVLVLALLALNAFQFFVVSANSNADLAASENELAAVKDELADLEEDFADLEDDYDELMDSAGNAAEIFAQICDYGDGNVIGFGSDEFYAHRSVIVMSAGQEEYFTITCAYSGTVTAELSIDGDDVIDANFSGSWSGDETDVNVEALDAGAALITFTNDISNDTFAVLVIVVG